MVNRIKPYIEGPPYPSWDDPPEPAPTFQPEPQRGHYPFWIDVLLILGVGLVAFVIGKGIH